MASYNRWSFVTGFLSLSMMFSRFIHVGKCIKTWFLSKSFATTFYLSTQQLIDMWVVSTFWLL